MLTLSKKIPTKKGSWWPTGLKFINKSWQSLLNRGFSQAVLQGEACTDLPASPTELSACIVFLLFEPTLVKEFLEFCFNQ